jgi:hypothetical protein
MNAKFGVEKVKLIIPAILFIGIFCSAQSLQAATINAISCGQNDVQAAIASANNGDTVIVPSGNCAWSSRITLNKQLKILGAGIDLTIITAYGFSIPDGLDYFRISGFTWTTADSSLIPIIMGTNWNASPKTGWRIDHNKFRNTGAETGDNWVYAMDINGRTSNALIDHNDFYGCGIRQGSDDNTGRWEQPANLGTNDFLFIEDNIFYQETYHHLNHVYVGNRSARVVFRYNSIEETTVKEVQDAVDMHGYCHGSAERGGRAFEIYSNTFKKAYMGGDCCRPIMIRGGTGVIYDNYFDLTVRSWKYPIFFVDYRASQWGGTSSTCSATCSTAQWCSLALGGEGYPCCDQVGRGQSQTLDPVYLWNNKNQNQLDVSITVDSGSASYIQLNRDYYTARKPGYTPYVYPHPLTNGICPEDAVTIQGKQGNYTSIQAAYDEADTDQSILMQVMTFDESLTLNKYITLRGGYNCGFTSNDSGYSTISGKVTLGGLGRVIFENMIIR